MMKKKKKVKLNLLLTRTQFFAESWFGFAALSRLARGWLGDFPDFSLRMSEYCQHWHNHDNVKKSMRQSTRPCVKHRDDNHPVSNDVAVRCSLCRGTVGRVLTNDTDWYISFRTRLHRNSTTGDTNATCQCTKPSRAVILSSQASLGPSNQIESQCW